MPKAFQDNQALSLPTSMSGVLLQRVADFIVVRDPESDFYVKWDGLESIFIRVRVLIKTYETLFLAV